MTQAKARQQWYIVASFLPPIGACTIGESELFHDRRGSKRLTEKQVEWLDSLNSEISDFLYDNPTATPNTMS